MDLKALTVSPMADRGAALCRATSMILSTKIEIYLSLAKISLCSGAIKVSSDKAGGGMVNKAAAAEAGAMFSLPKAEPKFGLRRDKFPHEPIKRDVYLGYYEFFFQSRPRCQ